MRGLMVATSLMAGSAAMAAPIAYPSAPRGDVVDRAHGIAVADPYRWLEGDVRTTPQVRAWVDAENRVTQAYLATLPRRDAIKARLTQLWDYEKVQVPVSAGGKLFYRHNTGLQNQFVLRVRDNAAAAPRTLIDPNGWSRDGATALAEWEPSHDGRYVAYTVQDGGTDWRTIRTIEVATGHVLPETLEWAKFTDLAWDAKSEGYFYSRHPANPKGRDFVSAVYDHMVWYHRVGTEQSADRLVFRTPDHLNYYNVAQGSADGRWLILNSSRGSDDRYEVRAIDTSRANPSPVVLAPGTDFDWKFAGARGSELYFVTNKGAPLYRVVAFNTAHECSVREVVPEGKSRIEEAALVGERIVVARLVDAKSTLSAYGLGGGAGVPIALPGIGSTHGLRETRADEPTMFYGFSSFATPASVFAWDARGGATRSFAVPKAPFRPADYEVREVFYASKDGTRVPMFVARRKGTSGPAPTMLYGYGGFNINIVPGFSPATVAWMEMGGVYAQPSIRGGGEYGTPWHEGGKLFHKQNVFDDFIAAGEWLKANGVASKLVVRGGSNGGLLVGAVTNQRPDLFAAALPAVGVMDMTRFHLFTEGRTWTDDYGDPADPAALKYNLTYSPYHNIRSGMDYPAILVATADTDDRVVPGHSFKYTAALQAAKIGDKPHLIRVETRAGHGSGKPTAKIIEETADEWAFAGFWTGLTR